MDEVRLSFPALRIARPVGDLYRSESLYCSGLEWQVLSRFNDHDGFSGVIVGEPGALYHFEFVRAVERAVPPGPTPEDLVVFYIPRRYEWERRCEKMLAAGFVAVEPHNPYWARRGRTFVDPDGYRLVLQSDSWPAGDRE